MEEIKWESVKIKVNGMVEGDAEFGNIPDDVVGLTTMMLESGDRNEATRDSITNSVKAMLRPYDGYPWKKGNQGLLPVAAKIVVDNGCQEIREAAIVFFETTQQHSRPLLRKHGKSAGSPVYDDASDYANTLAEKARKTATKLYKKDDDGNQIWDGTVAGLVTACEWDEPEDEETDEGSE